MQNTINGKLPAFYSELLKKYGFLHAFTTCRGGVSTGAFSSLNVSTRRIDKDGLCDKYENTVENFRRVLSLVGAVPEKSVCAHQVHGKRIFRLDGKSAGMGILKSAKINEDADGLLLTADTEGIEAICVKSADCTPILFADIKSGSVCAVHSGWRGTVADIPGNAVRAMTESGSRPQDIVAVIGPCIGSCCYEVSLEVFNCAHNTFLSKGLCIPDGIFTDKRETENGIKYNFDMAKMCRHLITLSGVPFENTEILGLCTCCFGDGDGRVFFSHRGQGGFSGTFASVIAPKR